MKVIEIIVRPNGETILETKGFTGPECREASRFLEQALGRPVREQLTPEFHQTQSNEESAQTHTG